MSFASFNVASQIFYRSKFSYALVNLKPIVPGHILVIPQRIVPRLSDLHEDEVADLFTSVQRVSAALQQHFHAQGATISLQDGPVAGQSVPHVHVHVLPRKRGDIENNDDVYAKIDCDSASLMDDWTRALKSRPQFTAVDDEDRKPRTMKEMEEEAARFRTLFE